MTAQEQEQRHSFAVSGQQQVMATFRWPLVSARHPELQGVSQFEPSSPLLPSSRLPAAAASLDERARSSPPSCVSVPQPDPPQVRFVYAEERQPDALGLREVMRPAQWKTGVGPLEHEIEFH